MILHEQLPDIKGSVSPKIRMEWGIYPHAVVIEVTCHLNGFSNFEIAPSLNDGTQEKLLACSDQ